MKGEEWGGRRKSPLASYCSQIKIAAFGKLVTTRPATDPARHGDYPTSPSFSVVIVGMQIQLNGSTRTITPAMTVAGLVRELGVPSASVVIEHNRAILQPDSYATVLLEDNDHVEIIRFVGGG
jgi:thiamine biosynthesis protein ThiS